MNRFKLAALTFAVASAFWLSLGAWWSLRQGTKHPAEIAGHTGAPPEQATAKAKQPTPQRDGAFSAAVDSDLLIPVAGVAAKDLVDTFTQGRAEGARHHDAIDIPAPRGTPVIAAAPGIVEKLFYSQEGGKTIYVRNPDRTRIYYYAHLRAYAPGLSEGQVIGAGDQLGSVGSTGNASREVPHLHFEIMATARDQHWYEHKRSLNPYPMLAGH